MLHLMENPPLKDSSTCQVVHFMETSINSHPQHPPLFAIHVPSTVTVHMRRQSPRLIGNMQKWDRREKACRIWTGGKGLKYKF